MKNLYYPAVFHPEDEGFSVVVPDIDGCFTQGDSLEEAMEMTFDAIGLCLEDCQGKFPVPSMLPDIRVEPGDFASLVAFDVLAYARKHNAKAVKKSLTVPAWLNAAAMEANLNFSSILQAGLKEQLQID